ncbi:MULTISPECIES: hypothetical protein [unclassified Acinetobacter]|uniref:hypothetical protein n=1 Tax=unclassified Acinetobacter TaxID=196816 RepID=UPI0029351E05|nr:MULTISPECIES: hypothetical protein [unclassified Acinetobacter]WOE32099.1 hypothetical protein QSG84_02485 [Acinetobacter sp. SAAs470]WOE37568.1 hypothetical protein QSG86_11530 [Acinetobacter sp. SAAs474]
MLDIYLTDAKKSIQFKDYPGEHPVKFILDFKKIFPSVMELLLPVLPENENLEEMQWESTRHDFECFQLLLTGWGVIELRLATVVKFKDKSFADQIVVSAQMQRKQFAKAHAQLKSIELDYLMMHEIHARIDAELIEVGEKFYLPILRNLWKDKISTQVIEAKI